VLGMLAHFVPVTLGPEANPTDSQYLPRPEWYFLPMFQWLKYWEGSHAVLGIVMIPAVLGALMFLLPFLDRGVERRPWRRPIPVGGVLIVLGGLLWLGMTSHLEDSRDAAVAAQLAQQSQQESAYSLAAFQPYAASAALGAAASPPLDASAAQGKTVFDARCSSCHGVGGVGARGPALTQIASQYQPAQLTALLRAPTAKMTAAGMVAVAVSGDDMTALVSYVTGLRGGSVAARGTLPPAAAEPHAAGASPSAAATAEPDATGERPLAETGTSAALAPAAGSPTKAMPGEMIYQAQGCVACHGVGGTGTSRGPDLTKLSQTMTAAALTNVLQHPTDKMHAGGMPPVQPTGTGLSALVAYLQSFATPATALTPATGAGAASSSASPVASHQVETIAPPRAMNDSEAKGKVVFEAHGCAKCHGTGGVAGTAAAAGLAGAVRTPAALLATMLRHPTALMQRGGMPPISLSDTDLEALVAYVSYISVLTRHPQ
jgi:menaquinol-cytochrome c reductase cytochrome b/c subunit